MYHQVTFGERAPAIGSIICFYRKDLPRISHRPKISIFAPQEGVAPIHVNFGRTKGHVCLLDHAKFHGNPFTGVRKRSQKVQKFPLYGSQNPTPTSTLVRAGNRLTRVSQLHYMLGASVWLTGELEPE